MKIIKTFIVVLLGIFGAALFILGSSNFVGVCLTEKRILSDSEKVQLALEYTNHDKIPVETIDKSTKYYEALAYKNAQEILEKNPECCKIYYSYKASGDYAIPQPSFWAKVFGREGGTIIADFTRYYVDEMGNKQSVIINRPIHLQNCGNPDSDPD